MSNMDNSKDSQDHRGQQQADGHSDEHPQQAEALCNERLSVNPRGECSEDFRVPRAGLHGAEQQSQLQAAPSACSVLSCEYLEPVVFVVPEQKLKGRIDKRTPRQLSRYLKMLVTPNRRKRKRTAHRSPNASNENSGNAQAADEEAPVQAAPPPSTPPGTPPNHPSAVPVITTDAPRRPGLTVGHVRTRRRVVCRLFWDR